MHLTSEDIEKLGERYKSGLETAIADLPGGSMDMSQLQDWMLKHHLERPELLELLIKKTGTGSRTEKKTAHTVDKK